MYKMMSGFFLSVLLTTVQAAEMDHSKMDHGSMGHDQMTPEKMDHSKMGHAPVVRSKSAAPGVLVTLAKIPASGKAREGGADDRYVMESTSVFDNVADQCAKASRGLMMLDNATWAQCGGKPQGAAMTPVSMTVKKDSNEHAGHNMH